MKKNDRTKSKGKPARANATRHVSAMRRVKYTDEPMELGKAVPDFLPRPEQLRFSRRTGPRVTYDAPSDTLTLRLSDRSVAESDESTPGIIVDYDDEGEVVGIELLDASKRSANPRAIEVIVND